MVSCAYRNMQSLLTSQQYSSTIVRHLVRAEQLITALTTALPDIACIFATDLFDHNWHTAAATSSQTSHSHSTLLAAGIQQEQQ